MFGAWYSSSEGPDKPSTDLPKYEAGADFTTFTINGNQIELGAGGRFTYNINKSFALEAAGYFSSGHVR